MKIRKTIAMIMALSILGGAVLPVGVYAETEEKTYTVKEKDEETKTDVDLTIKVTSETVEKRQTGYQAENPVTVDHIMYDILEDHAVIFGYEDELEGDLVIPSEINEVPVTTINKEAFMDCDGITSVVFPESIIFIGGGAFKYCDNIKSAEFLCDKFDIVDENDTYGEYDGIFLYCPSIEEITYKATFREDAKRVRLINYLLFSTKYHSFDKEMDPSLFIDRTDSYEQYSSIIIPNSLKKVVITDGDYIATRELGGLSSLEEIVLPDNLKEIKSLAFDECTNLKKINLPDSLTTIGDSVFSASPDIEFGDLKLPSHLEVIGRYAFSGVKNITSVVFPESIITIDEGAFKYCDNIRSAEFLCDKFNIADNAEEGGEYDGIFLYCSSLEEVTYKAVLREDAKYSRNISFMLFSTKRMTPDREIDSSLFTDQTDYPQYLSIVVPNSFKKVVVTDGEFIQTYEFIGLSTLEEVVLPDTLKEIRWSAFMDCTNLKKINLPDSLTNIGVSAFASAPNIEFGDLELPPNLEVIGIAAFAGAKNLTSVKLPASLKKIGTGAFKECENLKKVTFESHPIISTKLEMGQKLSNPDRVGGILEDCSAVDTVETLENTFRIVDSEGYSMEFSVDEAMFGFKFNKPQPGDVNNDDSVNLADAVLIMQSLCNPGKYALSDNEKIIADVSNKGDGVTNKDALAIQKYMLKLINKLPEEEKHETAEVLTAPKNLPEGVIVL